MGSIFHKQRRARYPNIGKPLKRDSSNKLLAGVLSGIANYIEANPFWVRFIFLFAVLASVGIAAVAYLLLWLLLPKSQS